MQVKVETTCGRCSKVDEQSMELSAAQNMENETEARAKAAAELVPIFNEAFSSPEFPDIVVAVRSEDGTYSVKSLDQLCHNPDAARNKGCKARVDSLIHDIFTMEPAKPRAKKKAPLAEPKKTAPPKGKSK